MAQPRPEEIAELILSQEIHEEFGSVESPPPPPSPPLPEPPPWVPDLNPTQAKAFNDPALNILLASEKATGKTVCAAHMGVRHAFDNKDALVIIITGSLRTGAEGIWYDLDSLVMPHWKEGIGLEYTVSKYDPLTKDRHRWVKNRHGGWSKIMLMSIQFAKQVERRIKAMSPSMIIVEELTDCEGREYFIYPKLQLNRRRSVEGPQQYVATCNPEGPEHWVYKVFYVECIDENTGKRDPDFSVYHVPISENYHRIPKEYVEQLKSTLRNDPIEYRRLILGEWVERPRGDGILSGYYNVKIHVKGDVMKGEGLIPVAGFPIYIGYDLGQMWSNACFLQNIPTKNGSIWIGFDEINHFSRRILYKTMAWEVIDKMRFWREKCKYDFNFMHITDETAWVQWRPSSGSFDATEFEKEFNKVAVEFKREGQTAEASRMRMISCPKGHGSISARVRLIQGKLAQDELFISDLCKGMKDMMGNLEVDNDNPDNPKRTHPYIDVFDSFSYPIFKVEMNASRSYLPTAQAAPRLIRCGTG